MQRSSSPDQVILVDDLDREIGVMDKIEAHRGEGRLHRAISVYLINTNQKVLMQQRSDQKIVGAGQWANTCCGNVRPGETYEQCAHRRLHDELGIVGVQLKPVHMFTYAVKCNEEFSEREMDQVFVARYDGDVRPNPDEVASWEWSQLSSLIGVEDVKYAPWFRLMMKDSQLTAILQGEV